jgi:hypothetical protein
VGIMSSGSRIARMAVLVGLVAAALASTSSAAPVMGRARSAAACAPVRVNGGQGVGTQTVRFKLIGHVSCATAQGLARTYFHKIATGQCGQLNNFCDLRLGGWDCSIFFATESQETGGASAGCARERGSARVRFYTSSPHHQAAETGGKLAAPRLSLAAEYFGACANDKALHVGIQVHDVSCAKARRIVTAYLHEKVGPMPERVKGYPAWTCSTGDRSGTCSKGRIRSGGPEIGFYYLELPG